MQAKRFRTMRQTDPCVWGDVIRRVTVDSNTGEQLSDEMTEGAAKNYNWHDAVPETPWEEHFIGSLGEQVSSRCLRTGLGKPCVNGELLASQRKKRGSDTT